MQATIRLLLASATVLAAASPASAQCRFDSFTDSTGAVDGSHGIVALWGGSPWVQFLEKGRTGWRVSGGASLGDFQLFVPVAVALDGDRAIAGAPEATHGTVGLAGRAWIFDRVGDDWIPTELVSPTYASEAFFGTSVAIRGDVAVVGVPHQVPGDSLARAHVFEFDGSQWSEVAQLTNYGPAIAVDGDTIVLGDALVYPGQVQVYERIAGTWTWTAELTVPTQPEGPYFGSSVALEGDRLVVGAAVSGQAPGIVTVFRRQNGVWQPEQNVFPLFRADYDRFGASVALDGPSLFVGAPGAHHENGRVFRYEHDGTRFVEQGEINSDGGGGFGACVSVRGLDAFLGGFTNGSVYRLGFEHAEAFCPTTPNSTGAHGSLAVEGCDSRSGSQFWLVATGLPPTVLALGFFGANAAQVPFGDGFRCVGSPLHRLPAGETTGGGAFATAVDFGSPPASLLAAGRTWNFQVVHRDHIGAGLNLTNALSVGITP